MGRASTRRNWGRADDARGRCRAWMTGGQNGWQPAAVPPSGAANGFTGLEQRAETRKQNGHDKRV